MGLDNFEFREDVLYCKVCGKVIERGIINVSNHDSECGGKDFYTALMGVANEKKGKITLYDVDDIINKIALNKLTNPPTNTQVK